MDQECRHDQLFGASNSFYNCYSSCRAYSYWFIKINPNWVIFEIVTHDFLQVNKDGEKSYVDGLKKMLHNKEI